MTHSRHRPCSLADFIDLNQYPIDNLDSIAGQSLIERCQQMMTDTSICILPGFLNPAAVTAIASEINCLESDSRKIDFPATPYGWMNNAGFPANHPRSQLMPRRCSILTAEQIDGDGLCHRLYRFNELTEFIRRLLGYATLYRTACPTISVRVNLMGRDDEFGWHFDTNDGVVSLITQNADQGGVFEFKPLIRDEKNENYDRVALVFDDKLEVKQARTPAGSFTLFLGRRSLHRVSKVGPTALSRQSLLFAYDRKPGMVFPDNIRNRLLHPSSSPFLGTGPRST